MSRLSDPGGRDGGPGAGGESPGQERKKAYAYALKLLGYRQRSERELLRRLGMKGFSAGAAEETISRLRELGLVDDRAMAGALRLRAQERKLLGLRGARHLIGSMGIARQEAEEALQGYEETEGARRLAEKKMKTLSDCPARTARQKLAETLRRRGFSSVTIKKTIDEFIKEEK